MSISTSAGPGSRRSTLKGASGAVALWAAYARVFVVVMPQSVVAGGPVPSGEPVVARHLADARALRGERRGGGRGHIGTVRPRRSTMATVVGVSDSMYATPRFDTGPCSSPIRRIRSGT